MEERVYCYLITYHVGINNLIKNKDLRKVFNIKSDKTLRKIIQNIREDEKYVIVVGSVSGRTGGFYVCQTEEEVNDTIMSIRNRAIQMLMMCKKLRLKKEAMLK